MSIAGLRDNIKRAFTEIQTSFFEEHGKSHTSHFTHVEHTPNTHSTHYINSHTHTQHTHTPHTLTHIHHTCTSNSL